jgi:hypothetical protein
MPILLVQLETIDENKEMDMAIGGGVKYADQSLRQGTPGELGARRHQASAEFCPPFPNEK